MPKNPNNWSLSLVIGRFCAKAISSQGVASTKQQGKTPSSSSPTKEFSNTTASCISKNFVSLIIVQHFIDFQLSGDVESNPGLNYAFEKIIFGSFHHGNLKSAAGVNSYKHYIKEYFLKKLGNDGLWTYYQLMNCQGQL